MRPLTLHMAQNDPQELNKNWKKTPQKTKKKQKKKKKNNNSKTLFYCPFDISRKDIFCFAFYFEWKHFVLIDHI